MFHSAASCFVIAEDANKENIAPAGYVAPPSMSRGLAMKKGLAPSARPLAEISANTQSSTTHVTHVRIFYPY